MGEIKLNRKLNMVIPIETRDGITIYVHSTPIMRETFETYFEPIARTFTQIYSAGHGIYSGPRVAELILRKVATQMNMWDGENGVKNGLIVEIHRLTNVATPSPAGWTYLPWEIAVKDGLVDEDDASEVENALVFFTVASAMHKKSELRPLLESALSLWGAQPESLKLTDYLASLPTSTVTENTGGKPTVSSIPS